MISQLGYNLYEEFYQLLLFFLFLGLGFLSAYLLIKLYDKRVSYFSRKWELDAIEVEEKLLRDLDPSYKNMPLSDIYWLEHLKFEMRREIIILRLL